MKKINVLFLMTFLMVGTLSFVTAQDDFEEFNLPEANKIGFFENAFDNMGYAFTFNKEKKIQRALQLAEKRLAEAEILAEEDPEAAEKAQEEYNAFVAKAEGILEGISKVEAENENLSLDGIEKMARIQNRFEQHREHAERIHVRALERFETNGASAEKIERFEGFYNKALVRSDQMEDKILQKKEANIKLHKVLTEKSDEELKVILESVEKKEGLADAQEKRIERAEVRTQEIIELKQRDIEKIKTRLSEGNLTNEQKQQIADRVRATNQKIQEIEVKARERTEAREKVASFVAKASGETSALEKAAGQGTN